MTGLSRELESVSGQAASIAREQHDVIPRAPLAMTLAQGRTKPRSDRFNTIKLEIPMKGHDDKRHGLMFELLHEYFSGRPILESELRTVRYNIHLLQRRGEEWDDAKMILHLYEGTSAERHPSTDIDIFRSFGRRLELMWTFCPTLTKAMERKDNCMKDVVYYGLAQLQRQFPQSTLSGIAKDIIHAMPSRNEGLVNCINAAFDVAKTPSWEDLMSGFSRKHSSLKMGPEENDVIYGGLRMLGACPWPQTERELIDAVAMVTSRTHNRFTPIQILQRMILLSQSPRGASLLVPGTPSRILSRLNATLLVLKFIEPYTFSPREEHSEVREEAMRNEGSRALTNPSFSGNPPRQQNDRAPGGSNLSIMPGPLTRVGKVKQISPRKLKSMKIETRLAEIASRRVVNERDTGDTGVSPPKTERTKLITETEMPRKSLMAMSPPKLSSGTPRTDDAVSRESMEPGTMIRQGVDVATALTAKTQSPGKSLEGHTHSSDLPAVAAVREERDTEIDDLLNNVSSNEGPAAPEPTPVVGPPSSTSTVKPPTSPRGVLVKQEPTDIIFEAPASVTISAADARAKIAHLQPGVGRFLESIQGHDPHVAKAFLVRLLMSGQVDTSTTLEQVQQQKLRYPRHMSFFLPKEDKLLLQLMRGANARPSKLNRLLKRHLASDIDLRAKFLAYLRAIKES